MLRLPPPVFRSLCAFHTAHELAQLAKTCRTIRNQRPVNHCVAWNVWKMVLAMEAGALTALPMRLQSLDDRSIPFERGRFKRETLFLRTLAGSLRGRLCIFPRGVWIRNVRFLKNPSMAVLGDLVNGRSAFIEHMSALETQVLRKTPIRGLRSVHLTTTSRSSSHVVKLLDVQRDLVRFEWRQHAEEVKIIPTRELALEELSLYRSGSFPDADFYEPILRACPALTRLTMTHCKPTVIGAIVDICPRLHHLDLGATLSQEEFVRVIPYLGQLKQLESLAFGFLFWNTTYAVPTDRPGWVTPECKEPSPPQDLWEPLRNVRRLRLSMGASDPEERLAAARAVLPNLPEQLERVCLVFGFYGLLKDTWTSELTSVITTLCRGKRFRVVSNVPHMTEEDRRQLNVRH